MLPNGKDLLGILISLYAEQEGLNITYKLEVKENA